MPSLDQIIDRQLHKWELERKLRSSRPEPPSPGDDPRPVITVSRQRGSGGTVIAHRLAERFGYTLLHRDAIDRICESSGTRRHIVESLDEHAKSQVTIWFESMINQQYLDATDYVKHLLRTIYSIARLGGVVVVGRGSSCVIGPEHGFHLRVVAPREVRVRRIAERHGWGEKEAARSVESADHDRAEFIRRTFRRDIEDPQGYDLVLNTGWIGIDAAVRIAGDAAMEKFERLRERAKAGVGGGS